MSDDLHSSPNWMISNITANTTNEEAEYSNARDETMSSGSEGELDHPRLKRKRQSKAQILLDKLTEIDDLVINLGMGTSKLNKADSKILLTKIQEMRKETTSVCLKIASLEGRIAGQAEAIRTLSQQEHTSRTAQKKSTPKQTTFGTMRTYFIVLICVFASAVAEGPKKHEYKEKTDAAMKACSEELNVSITNPHQYIGAMMEGGEQVEKFCQCMLKKLGYLDDKEEIKYDEIKKTPMPGIPAEKFAELVDQCKNETGNTSAQTSYKFSKCLLVGFMKRTSKHNPHMQKKMEAMKACAAKNNLTMNGPEEYKKALAAGGEKMHSFCECVLRELNYIDGSNNILYEEIKKIPPPPGLSPEKYSAIVDECKGEKGSNIGETSYKFSKCLMQKAFQERKPPKHH
ncbi:hypothetical protein FQA39_LY17790 [Lamprigera yunnana]|nr:hypothetical protein FQA39_LY17790 [Lamprigera yunnana]